MGGDAGSSGGEEDGGWYGDSRSEVMIGREEGRKG